jgi:hypothetical protein
VNKEKYITENGREKRKKGEKKSEIKKKVNSAFSTGYMEKKSRICAFPLTRYFHFVLATFYLAVIDL